MKNIYMNIAVDQSLKALENNNVPVGAVIVKDGKIISKAYNKKNSKNVSFYHAEVLAIEKACKKLKRWILDDCDLYVTMKPCQMCHYVIAESRIRNVYYLLDSNYYHNLENNSNKIIYNVLHDDYLYFNIVNNFFKNMRNNKK